MVLVFESIVYGWKRKQVLSRDVDMFTYLCLEDFKHTQRQRSCALLLTWSLRRNTAGLLRRA